MCDQEFTVFYAWQSDLPSQTNRSFIEDALKTALRNIEKTGKIEASPRLDKDTQGIPGMPDIASTILDKIRSADAFVADVSFIGNVPGVDGSEDKVIPNPNVMIELGYALSELGPNRIVCVLNANSGSPDKLPFDLRNRRWPLQYELQKDADQISRSTQKERLTKAIQSSIESIANLRVREKGRSLDQRFESLEKALSELSGSFVDVARKVEVLAQASSTTHVHPDNSALRCDQLRRELIERVNTGGFERIESNRAAITLTICSAVPRKPLQIFDHEDMLKTRLKPLYTSAWNHARYGDRFVTYSQYDGKTENATEIDCSGVIQAVDCWMISLGRHPLEEAVSSSIRSIPSVAFEKTIISGIQNYLIALRELGADGPWDTAIGLIGLGESILAVAPHLAFDGRVFKGDAILPPSVTLSPDIDPTDPQAIAHVLRTAFDHIWREYNYPRSLNYNQSGDWVGH